jgi:hypothetical protein
MARPLTPSEKTQFHQLFPNLNVDQAVVTGEATPVYNCISWTVGVTNAWLWPGSTIQEFDAFYARYNLRRRPSGNVAAWGASTADMRHGSVSGPGHGPRWESKCGALLRIEHGRDELVSKGYGSILAYYSRTNILCRLLRRLIDAIRKVNGKVSVMPTEAQIAAVRAAARRLPLELRDRFDASFSAWKRQWSLPEIAISSNPRAVTYLTEFHALIALGSIVIPAVVEKLLEPDNFFALQLYDKLQSEKEMIVSFDPATDDAFEGEQGRARKTVERYARSLYRGRSARGHG